MKCRNCLRKDGGFVHTSNVSKESNKAKAFILASVLIAAGSVLLLIRAESLRRSEEAEFKRSIGFAIYSSPNNQKFAEDYIGYLLLLLAPVSFIYGVWIRKSAKLDSAPK